jgi:DNA polymerase
MIEELKYYLSYLGERGVRSFSFNYISPENDSATSAYKRTDDPDLENIRTEMGDCKLCRLHELRTNIVFGEGNKNARLMFIGEGPGQEEDKSGRPFVGKAGQLLTKIIDAMGFSREEVYIANIVKCRPPGNRAPLDDEVITCSDFLMRQILVIKPSVIVSLGAPATCTMFGEKIKISSVRGRFKDLPDGVKLMPTFHPAYLLRNPSDKRLVWDDMQKVMEYLKNNA